MHGQTRIGLKKSVPFLIGLTKCFSRQINKSTEDFKYKTGKKKCKHEDDWEVSFWSSNF